MSNFDKYRQNIVYLVQAGSRAYGLNRPDSDTDIRGVYIAPTEEIMGLRTPPEDLDQKQEDKNREFWIWELGKFCNLALKSNPNVLETLWSLNHLQLKIFEPFRKHRKAFLSKRIITTYRGYATSQFHKMGQDQNQKGEIRWKHAMHLLRLMHSGTVALHVGEIPVLIGGKQAELLKRVGRGEMDFGFVMSEYKKSEKIFDEAADSTKLPEHPDEDLVNEMLIAARIDNLRRQSKNDWGKFIT